jgi:hypothetical protein
MLTVTPRLELLIGLSARRPLTGFKKHHAGTTPISMFSPGSWDLNKDLAVWTKVELSLPTTHHPSSNDCTIVRRSPGNGRSSSGRTGSNCCRTLRVVPDVELIVEVPDIQEIWLYLLALIKELRPCDVSLGPMEFKAAGRAPARGVMEPGVRVNGLGSAGWGTAKFIRAFSGRMTAELIICLENPLVNLVEK